MSQIGIAIIGAGAIALANHLHGLRLDPRANLIALCDTNPATLDRAGRETGISALYADYNQAIAHDGVDAIIVATPNFTHPPIVFAACAAKKHILCEKPLALNYPTALAMYRAAEDAGIRHMTAFTYRFVPAMRYMKHLIESGSIGQPYHFRAQRFQDWGNRALGWRQIKKLAGTGEMGDMLSHRIDYAHHLVGPIASVYADFKNYLPERGGQLSDVDDWVAMIARFENDATAVLESTKLATGRGEGHRGQDIVEVNGSDGSIVYSTQNPLQLRIGGKTDKDLRNIGIPPTYHVWPGSPRDPSVGDPLATFRFDQDFEFIDAIVNKRSCNPSFYEGARVQAVMDAAIESHRLRAAVDVVR